MLWQITFWKPSVVYNAKTFIVEYNSRLKTTFTRFPDGHWAGGLLDSTEENVAAALELEPDMYNLQRHLALSLVAKYCYKRPYSSVLWRVAHDSGASNGDESRAATAIQYDSRGKQALDAGNIADTLSDMRDREIDPKWLGKQLQTMLDVARWL